jgi:hypothetical protein
MEIALDTAGDDALSLDFGGALTLERDASGLRLARRSLASDEMLSLLARRGSLAADFHRPVERGDFH